MANCADLHPISSEPDSPYMQCLREQSGSGGSGTLPENIIGGIYTPNDINSGYVDGDQYGLVQGWSVERRMSVQDRLIRSGLLDREAVIGVGEWGHATANAFSSVLAHANATGQSWRTAINTALGSMQQVEREARASAALTASRSGGGGGGGGGGGVRVAPQIRLSNADDLRRVFREGSRQLTGGKYLEDDQVNQMVQAYQAIEKQKQQEAIAGASVIEDAPSADAFLEDQLETADPGAIKANRFAEMTAGLMQLTGGQ